MRLADLQQKAARLQGAGKASIDAEAVRLRKAGLPGTLGLGNPEASPIVTECHIACTLCRR
jgi:hypothetical protein